MQHDPVESFGWHEDLPVAKAGITDGLTLMPSAKLSTLESRLNLLVMVFELLMSATRLLPTEADRMVGATNCRHRLQAWVGWEKGKDEGTGA